MAALREFVADLLECEGAAVDRLEPDALDVLAPESVRAALGWPELARLAFGPAAPEGAVHVGLEGDWLDRLGRLLGERGRLAERQLGLAPGAPPAGLEDAIARAVELPNAVWRLRSSAPAWARCLLLAFRYTAISDEKREGLVWLGLNGTTGGCLGSGLLDRLRAQLAAEAEWQQPDPEISAAVGRAGASPGLAARVGPLLETLVREDLGPFVRAMRRRLERDRDRIHAYHDGLRRSAQLRLQALEGAAGEKAEAERSRERLRIAAVEREYAAKLADLRHNYALQVSAEWVLGVVLYVPVHRCELLIRRRKGERVLQIDWHVAARAMERLPVDWGCGLERVRLVCDERLHLTDAAGQAPCPACGKGWCRACHPQACSRCGRAGAAQSSRSPR